MNNYDQKLIDETGITSANLFRLRVIESIIQRNNERACNQTIKDSLKETFLQYFADWSVIDAINSEQILLEPYEQVYLTELKRVARLAIQKYEGDLSL